MLDEDTGEDTDDCDIVLRLPVRSFWIEVVITDIRKGSIIIPDYLLDDEDDE